ncbi:AMP-binding enzyme [Labedella endophytica]|uniref:Long-chain fatty acid--CoA ligase n=1 Tax=Labedella endophytica TaxID=1523160 RepID=A0A3S0VTK7_9MICO|nr:class I adenylate-forming enzyme family protein [Labedella endophytica]RUR01016.1 long-chain fatty acid--CoA ligase [Labedella endophytica]
MIVLVRDDTVDLLARLREIREAGDVPLVDDSRWSGAYRAAIAAMIAEADLPRDAAWASVTSGSSGSPRVVLRSAASWEDSFDTVGEVLGAGVGGGVALPAPPTSSLTLFSLAHTLAGGPAPVLGPVAASGAASLHGTPQALRAVLDAGVPTPLRAALIGGSHLDPELRERAEAAGIRMTAYYGAAELSFVAIDEGDGLRAFPGVELDVRDGVLWVRSPFIASGYLGAGGPLRQDDGWATVGDRAELVDGRLRLLGRADDAILSASATIVPEEVEAVLRGIPGVRDAVVFGLPREPVGALVAAFLELDGDLPEDVRARVDAQLAPAHRPRQWFTGVIPRTASGKPARADVVRRVRAGEAHRRAI